MKLMDLPPRRVHKKMLGDAGLSQASSQVDEVVFSRDMDGSSAQDVKAKCGVFNGASGVSSKEQHRHVFEHGQGRPPPVLPTAPYALPLEAPAAKPPADNRLPSKRILNDAGLNAHRSAVDEVVFGTDIDGSASAVNNVRKGRAFVGAVGLTSHEMNNKYDFHARRRPDHKPDAMAALLTRPD